MYLWLKTGYSRWMAVAVLAVVIFLFNNLIEKKSVPLTSQVLHVLKILATHQWKITGLDERLLTRTLTRIQGTKWEIETKHVGYRQGDIWPSSQGSPGIFLLSWLY